MASGADGEGGGVEPCRCEACTLAGADRPALSPTGRVMHGVELVKTWQAYEHFRQTVQALKDPALKAAAEKAGRL